MNTTIQKKAEYAERLVYMAYTKKVSEIEKDICQTSFDKQKMDNGLTAAITVSINVGFFTGIFAQPFEIKYMTEEDLKEYILQTEKENYAMNFLCCLNKYEKGHETDIFQFKIVYVKKRNIPIIKVVCCDGYDPTKFVYLSNNGEITAEDPRATNDGIVNIKSKIFDSYSKDQDLIDAFNMALMKDGYIYMDGDFNEIDIKKEIQNIFGNIFGGSINDDEEDEDD